jgi:hypothetical protein
VGGETETEAKKNCGIQLTVLSASDDIGAVMSKTRQLSGPHCAKPLMETVE